MIILIKETASKALVRNKSEHTDSTNKQHTAIQTDLLEIRNDTLHGCQWKSENKHKWISESVDSNIRNRAENYEHLLERKLSQRFI